MCIRDSSCNTPVIAVIGGLLRRNDRAFERNTGKQSLTAAVGVNCRRGRDVGLQITSHRAGRCAYVSAQLEVAATRKGAHSGIVVENEDKVTHLGADLQSPPGTAEPDEGWTRPSVPGSCHDHALASLSAEHESGFQHPDDCEAAGIPHDAARNLALWHFVELAKDFDRLINEFLFRGGDGSRGGHAT